MHKKKFLPEPTACDVCGASVTFIEHTAKFDKNRMIGLWKCQSLKCGALVSCHRDTKNPVGYMANERTRRLRSQCHKAFDMLWSVENSRWTRQTAYAWMAQLLSIPQDVANISKLTDDQMQTVIRESKEMYKLHLKVVEETKRQSRYSSKDRILRDSVRRHYAEKTNVKITARNYDCYERD